MMHACEVCREPRLLLAHIDPDAFVCAACWRRAGSPPPSRSVNGAAYAKAVEKNENETRARMITRKGADLHAVRGGRT